MSPTCPGGVVGRRAVRRGPLAFALPLDLPPPTLEDCLSDARATGARAAAPARTPRRERPGRGRSAPRRSRSARRAGRSSAVLARTSVGHELIDIRPGRGATRAFGVAVDIGTTTVVVHLVDLGSGVTLGAAAALNRQVRLRRRRDQPDHPCRRAGRPGAAADRRGRARSTSSSAAWPAPTTSRRDEIVAVACAGNTTMIHLFLGLPPAEIRREPYIPVATAPPTCHASQLGLRIHPRATVATMPGVSGWVGGDITADVVAVRHGQDGRAVDAHRRRDERRDGDRQPGLPVCCACSAGPAFEGGGISSGMRAAGGAIQRVEMTEDGALACATVGWTRPRGHLRLRPRRPAGRAAPGRVHGPRGRAPGRRAARARGPGRAEIVVVPRRGDRDRAGHHRHATPTSRTSCAPRRPSTPGPRCSPGGWASRCPTSSGSTSPAASAPISTSERDPDRAPARRAGRADHVHRQRVGRPAPRWACSPRGAAPAPAAWPPGR